jgi:outer membrane protein assembly factor BamA
LESVLNRREQFARPVFLVIQAVVFFLSFAFLVFASDASEAPNETRMATIEAQQEEKARNLVPSQPSRAERLLERYIGDDPMNKYVGSIPGLNLRFGGLPSGAGLSLGLEYMRPDLAGGRASFSSSVVGSEKQWYRIGTELQFPRLAGRYLDLKIQGWRLDANSVDYYGTGPDSRESDRINYRREENAMDVSLAFKPVRNYLSIGFVAGYQVLSISPQKASSSSSSEGLVSPDQAPAIAQSAQYLCFGPFLEVDSREKPNDPHVGTHFLVKFSQFDDMKFNQYSFRQIESSLEQYISFYNRKRVIALRTHTVLSYHDAGNTVPFYMQPTLGGGSDLRGYQRHRFYDNNLFLIGSEYRWEVFTLMDAAVFVDAGKVFHRDGVFNLDRMKSDAGFGFRFKTREAVVLRIDTAFSHEGIGVWLAFDHVF